ncbi:MAG TPA: hypothetical protein VMF66_12015 [Candidatus Acidoferrum sp.]|nr:hypothetical protein [Candidatus Acidoferrum sp.]
MQLPLALLDAAAIEEVPVDLWKDVFDVIGWPPSLAIANGSLGHEDVLHALERDPPSDSLLQVLEVLHTLGTEAGRDAIQTAMQDRHVSANGLPANKGEKEFALRFYIAQRNNASLADVFVRAQIQVQETGDQRRYNEFLGKEARCIRNLNAKKEKLREEILRHCREADLGEHVQVEAFEDEGTYIFRILRSHRTQKPLAVVQGHSARATIEFRPVHGDVMRYDASVGLLRIAARSSSIVEFYRQALGRVLFDDEGFFDGNAVCSLKVLQERGREALDNHGVFRVSRVRMTECLWERGDRELLHIRSNDCFRSMEELRLPLGEGRLLQAKLKCDVIGKSTRPVTVNIRVPSRIEVSQKIHETLIEKVLNAIGIRNAAPPSAAINFWTLRPWRHPIDVWRSVFGAETDRLIQERVLVPVQLAAVPHPDHAEAGHVLEAQAVEDGDFYGISQVEEIPSRSLTPTELDGFELMPEAFRLYLRSALGISSGGAVWDNGALLELGFIEVGDYSIYAVYALQQPPAGSANAVRPRAGTAHLAFLLPSPLSEASDLTQVTLEKVIPTQRGVIRDALCACGLADHVPAIHVAPDGARLIVDTKLGRIWVDGVEIGGLQPTSHPFKFITLMARGSAPVSRDEIVKELSSGRQDEDVAARQAKTAANKAIAKAMTAAGRSFDPDFFPAAGTGFYRCTLPAYVR